MACCPPPHVPWQGLVSSGCQCFSSCDDRSVVGYSSTTDSTDLAFLMPACRALISHSRARINLSTSSSPCFKASSAVWAAICRALCVLGRFDGVPSGCFRFDPATRACLRFLLLSAIARVDVDSWRCFQVFMAAFVVNIVRTADTPYEGTGVHDCSFVRRYTVARVGTRGTIGCRTYVV